MKILSITLTVLFFFTTNQIWYMSYPKEKTLAFPGAEGFGKYTKGGRGGLVYIVTNLNDNGIGSLRWAIESKGPRTIVFEISGNIKLQSILNVGDGDLTIAGQTAPGEGITIQNYSFKITGKSNIIIRFLRFRVGDLNGVESDSFGARNGENLIIDHCSFSWGTDETFSVYDYENVSIQNCIIAEGLNDSVHKKGPHGFGSLLGGDKISFYQNYLAHFMIRNPSLTTLGIRNGIIDIRNNIVYNWGQRTIDNGNATTANVINNIFKPGPATLKRGGNTPDFFLWPTGPNYGKFYLSGNKLIGKPEVEKNQWKGVRLENSKNTDLYLESCKNTDSVGNLITFSVPEDIYNKSLNIPNSIDHVLDHVGASLFRDPVDSRLVNEFKSNTVTYSGSKTGLLGIIDSQTDVGGWPILKSTNPLKDTDRDGMPDEWEINNGLDPEKRNDRFYDLDKEYTNLEVYINSLVNHIYNF